MEEKISAREEQSSAVIPSFERDDSGGIALSDLFAVCDALPLALFFITAAGEVRYANAASATLFDVDRERLIGSPLERLLPPAVQTRLETYLAEPAAGDFSSREFKIAVKGRGDRYLRLQLYPVWRRRTGESFRTVVVEDVTELHFLKSQLRKSKKLEAIGLLASGLAHNINSPLSAIIMTTEMAQMNHPEVRAFDDILQAASRIGEIVSNLMTKSRQEQALTETDLDLNQMIRTELKFLEANLFFKHSVELELDLQDDLPSIQGLYGDFSQVFHNLVQNALDAMSSSEDNRLGVCTRFEEDSDRIALSIRDNGCGILEDHVDKLFDPFFTTKAQVNSADALKPSGTGLGLHMTLQLLERYGGTIDVQSRPGEGSLFTVFIPVRRTQSV